MNNECIECGEVGEFHDLEHRIDGTDYCCDECRAEKFTRCCDCNLLKLNEYGEYLDDEYEVFICIICAEN